MMNGKQTGMQNVKKFDDNEINEAKEHLKLLKAKLGNTNFSQKLINQPVFNNNNFRKAFNPNFDEFEKKQEYNQKPSYTNTQPNTRKNNQNTNITYNTKQNNRVNRVEEVVDDRPAFNKKEIE
jgi:hypothetical protein